MKFDYSTIELLRKNHPAWRLLCAQHAPLIVSFLHSAFIGPNERNLAQGILLEKLDDELYVLREQFGQDKYPGNALDYLNDWADSDKGWLRKFYPPGTDEPHFDLTPAAEKGIQWLTSLTERSFVGTESRLLTLFELLRQMKEGSQTDPQIRISELKDRRDEIDMQISRILQGEIDVLDDIALKDRFQQFLQMARELLSDFREVEHNFRTLDRRVRERIAQWEGSKGLLLEEIMGERDAIADSDQGKSFRALWDFLMSQSRQDELGRLLEAVLALPPIQAMDPEPRLQRVHYDWLEAGEQTQRTVAGLSEQLRRFLDNQALLENRRIMDILHQIENHALDLRENMPKEDIMTVKASSASIELPLERPLYQPPVKPQIDSTVQPEIETEADLSALYRQIVIDRMELKQNISQQLQVRNQISLAEIIDQYPLKHGLAELVAYLQLAGEWPAVAIDDMTEDLVSWRSAQGQQRQAEMPRILFLRTKL